MKLADLKPRVHRMEDADLEDADPRPKTRDGRDLERRRASRRAYYAANRERLRASANERRRRRLEAALDALVAQREGR